MVPVVLLNVAHKRLAIRMRSLVSWVRVADGTHHRINSKRGLVAKSFPAVLLNVAHKRLAIRARCLVGRVRVAGGTHRRTDSKRGFVAKSCCVDRGCNTGIGAFRYMCSPYRDMCSCSTTVFCVALVLRLLIQSKRTVAQDQAHRGPHTDSCPMQPLPLMTAGPPHSK